MRQIELNSWEGFLDELYKIEPGILKSVSDSYEQSVLYRGQGSSEWHLISTLERFSSLIWRVSDYDSLLRRCIPEINSLTGHSWNPDPNQRGYSNPRDEIWTYLRHCGFPSPLIDWTISPYIAAFFAFEEKIDADKVAIFALIGRPQNIERGKECPPHITILSPFVKTHARHYLQQSIHTYCTQSKNNEDFFVSHEEIIDKLLNSRAKNDSLIKFILPRSERFKVLGFLDKFNINHFSLFQTEEALMRTLALRKIDFNQY